MCLCIHCHGLHRSVINVPGNETEGRNSKQGLVYLTAFLDAEKTIKLNEFQMHAQLFSDNRKQ